jgi:hypothetical protein
VNAGRERRSSSAKSVGQFRELGDQHYALRAARAHAWAHYEGGELERARTLYEAIIREAREAHDPFPEGIALAILGDIALDQGRVQDAVSLTTESYRIFHDLDDLLLIGFSVCRFARVLALSGRPEIATRVLSSSTAQLQEIGAMPPTSPRSETRRSPLSVPSSTRPPSPPGRKARR